MKFAVYALIGGASAVSVGHMNRFYENRVNYSPTSQTAIKANAAVGSVTVECNANPEVVGQKPGKTCRGEPAW